MILKDRKESYKTYKIKIVFNSIQQKVKLIEKIQ